ncbi:MAG: serine hydrolase [Flavobacteriales bacterium]|nr:serine hydrolase [Flavobacteriales bacterium]MCB9448807.1 serine hydrolase [Flavobacteriales bacterium]
MLRKRFRNRPSLRGLIYLTAAALVGMPLQADMKHLPDDPSPEENTLPPFLCCENPWVDSVMTVLTPDERIGQLFMVAAYSNQGEKHEENILSLIRDQHIGGLIFMQGGPVRQAGLTNRYQAASRIPLMMAMDAEWGLAMRLDSTVQYPRQMALGAMQGDDMVERMGADIARQMQRLGVQISFSPVVDVNSNPANPVIGSRSFGESKENVARKGLAYMRGLQNGHVLANAKHFPGHGDTDKDSHLALPVVKHSRARLDQIELYPFKTLIDAGVGSIMVAHLHVPVLDSAKNRATTLSHAVVTDLLKKQMNFRGLVFTDALGMKGVADFNAPGEVDVKALLAGNDVLLFSADVPKAIEGIKKAIADGKITQNEVDERCRRILMFKHWAGLANWKPVDVNHLYEDLNDPSYDFAQARIAEEAITLVKNDMRLVPLMQPDTLKMASLAIGAGEDNPFQTTMKLYGAVDCFQAGNKLKDDEIKKWVNKLSTYECVVLSVHNTSHRPSSNFGVTTTTQKLVEQLEGKTKVILQLFANPYVLGKIPSLAKANVIAVGYEEGEWLQKMSAEALWGAIPFKGKLPVTAAVAYPAGYGIETKSLNRLRYTVPEDAGIKGSTLQRIDDLVREAIDAGAFPGCQVLAARNGSVFFYKTYGYHTYDKKDPVLPTDIYDLASITKVAASTAAIMYWVDRGKINVDDTLGAYLDFPPGCNKGGIVIRDLLTHQAGLPAWIPFWKETMSGRTPSTDWYHKVGNSRYPLRVIKGMYARADLPDTMYARINAASLSGEKKYLYSDLGYYYMKKIVEKLAGCPLDHFVDSVFYKPMSLPAISFKPFEKFPEDRIPPTENDVLFRQQLVQGEVHDPGAAMLGGVGGHAGLFANAACLAAMMQMFLNKGTYGGRRYLSEATLNEFTKCQFCIENNRRGIGFDKPDPDPNKGGSACKCASYLSFGHSGFTGTLAWADPENGLLYVFLSNRVYPDAENKKLLSMNVRTNIQEVLYDALVDLNPSTKKNAAKP